MTTITVEGVDRAIDAGAWLEEQCIKYELFGIGLLSSDPKYQFKFASAQDATHFALRWR
jgi:hypothetical protein